MKDLECMICGHEFDYQDAKIVDNGYICPICLSDDILDLIEED